MVSGTSGRRSPTWMVIGKSPFVAWRRHRGAQSCAQGLLPFPARRILPVMESSPPFLSGRLLLAMPGMAVPRFERAVIAMAVHDENGAVGIGIGHKRAGIRFRSLLKQLGLDPGQAPDVAVHHGGPVEPGRGFVLHSEDWGGQDTVKVVGPNGNYAMTGTIDVLKAITEGKGPSQWLIALGY